MKKYSNEAPSFVSEADIGKEIRSTREGKCFFERVVSPGFSEGWIRFTMLDDSDEEGMIFFERNLYLGQMRVFMPTENGMPINEQLGKFGEELISAESEQQARMRQRLTEVVADLAGIKGDGRDNLRLSLNGLHRHERPRELGGGHEQRWDFFIQSAVQV